MATEQMTDYERKRLENIKRNSEMMASLKIHSHLSDLSSAKKHPREEKSYKQTSAKKSKVEHPIVIRRSLRIQELPPDSIGLPKSYNESPVKTPKSKTMRMSSLPESHPLPLEDLSLELTYEGEEGSHLALVEKLDRITRKTKSADENDHSTSPKKFETIKVEELIDPCSLKLEHDNAAHVVSRSSRRKTDSDDRNNHSNSPTKSERLKLEDPTVPRLLKMENDDIAHIVPGRSPRRTKSDDESGHSNFPTEFERVKLEKPIDPRSLKLDHTYIARVVPSRIFSIRFFPTTEMTMVVVGNKLGHLGFWDVRPQNGQEEDVVHLYRPHSAPISGISVHPFTLSKVYSSCYDGLLRMMNIEREKFELIHSGSSGSFSLAQRQNDANSLYFGDGSGGLNMLDARSGNILSCWPLHGGRVNTIDFCPKNSNIMATSSTDGAACIWDLRNMNVKVEDKHPESKALFTLKHARAVHSAYFSPSGSCLATTSLDDTIGVLSGVNYEDAFMIPHDNWTNRWVSSFRAVWGWDDTHLYIGNMKRRIDVLSVTQKKVVYKIESSNMSAIPCRYDAHPCNVGMLAGATSGGQVYIWTASS
ncbi:WD repeat-containing protein 76 [Bienertia sinuspersici]